MMGRRRSFLSLGIIVLMLALPWTAVADASGRGNEDEAEKVKISTDKDDQNQIEIEVEFENLTEYSNYDYEINITRVDPNYIHKNFSGNFATQQGVDEHTITEHWTPTQEGPYTVHTTLYRYGSVLANGTSTFGWGDVANNSDPASVTITVDPAHDHFEVMGDERAMENVTFGFERIDTENGATYVMEFFLFRVDDSSDGGGDDRLLSMGVQSRVANYNLSGINTSSGGLEVDTEYRFEVFLWLGEVGGPLVDTNEFVFTVGEVPPEPEDLLELEFNCVFGDYDIWHMVFDTGDTGEARGNTLNCAIYNPNVVTVAGTVNVSTTGIPAGAGIDHGMGPYSIEANSSQPELLSFDCGSGCTATNGTVTFKFDFHEENHTYWNPGIANHSIAFEIEENQTVITPEPIFGCKDENALNYDQNATDDDGSCTYPDPLRVILTANQTTGDAPLSVTFFADISEGRTPYQISWDFDDGTFAENLTTIEHIFHTAGVYNVHLQVTDADGEIRDRGIQIIATEPQVISNLTGYISHSGQLDPVNKGMVASVEFYGSANGGEGPYTFTWKFGDDTGETGATIFHEYANAGEFTVELIIEDSAGRTLQLEETVTIVKGEEESGGVTPPLGEVDGGENNFDIYATSTGAIGLLLIFGLFGRKRRESFLDAERRKAHGEGSMWDQR